MDDHCIKSTKVNDDNNNTTNNKIASVTNLDISTSSYINEIEELESLISEYDKLNAISNNSEPKTNVNNNKITSVNSNNKKSQVAEVKSLLTNLINKNNII